MVLKFDEIEALLLPHTEAFIEIWTCMGFPWKKKYILSALISFKQHGLILHLKSPDRTHMWIFSVSQKWTAEHDVFTLRQSLIAVYWVLWTHWLWTWRLTYDTKAGGSYTVRPPGGSCDRSFWLASPRTSHGRNITQAYDAEFDLIWFSHYFFALKF